VADFERALDRVPAEAGVEVGARVKA